MSDPLAASRMRCLRCWRPKALCLCATVPTIPTRTRIEILQHPQERTHPFGTARLVAMALPNARLHTVFGGLRGDLHHPLALPDDAAVLFPHPAAADLAELAPAARPSTLVVLDGTWAHAKRLYRLNPWLAGLRHVRLHPEPSRYRIRREPQADYVSTLEAVVAALRLLEPDLVGLDALLRTFDGMVDTQIDVAGRATRHGRYKLPRQRTSRRVPPLLADPRLIVVYAESSLPGGDVDATRELVHWVAARAGTGETFEAILRPGGDGPPPNHLRHMQLTAHDVAHGEPLAEARARFAAFAGDAPIAAWTATTFAWGETMLPAGGGRVVLKASYCNVAGQRAGFLEDVVAREAIAAAPSPVRGRAAGRLGNALAMARWLRERRDRAALDGADSVADSGPTG